MTTIVQPSSLELYEVEEKFGLEETRNPEFFSEWANQPVEISAHDRVCLDRAKADFLSLRKYPLHEEIVKIVIVAPILAAAGLSRAPFVPAAEKQVEVAIPQMDGCSEAASDEVMRGRIDLLVVHQQLWVTTIETKPTQADVLKALPQVLSYMMAGPDTNQPFFGLLTNGHNFVFVKLCKQRPHPIYALSELFTLIRQENDLYVIVAILQHFKQLVVSQDWTIQQAS